MLNDNVCKLHSQTSLEAICLTVHNYFWWYNGFILISFPYMYFNRTFKQYLEKCIQSNVIWDDQLTPPTLDNVSLCVVVEELQYNLTSHFHSHWNHDILSLSTAPWLILILWHWSPYERLSAFWNGDASVPEWNSVNSNARGLQPHHTVSHWSL